MEVLGPPRTFWLYALFAIAAWIFSYRLVPETKGRTLEEIERALKGSVVGRDRHAKLNS